MIRVVYATGKAGEDRVPSPDSRGRFEKAGQAICFGIFLFILQSSESFSHRFYFPTGELAGSCQGEYSMGCLTGCSDPSLSLSFTFPACLSVVINHLPGVQWTNSSQRIHDGPLDL